MDKMNHSVFPDFKGDLVGMKLDEWLRVCCVEGDQLRLIKSGMLALQNERTKVLYMIGAANEDAG